jgi:hypothetical protein
MKIIPILIFFLIISTASHAEDYSFEIPKPDEKKEAFELSGNLDMKYSVLKSRKSSPAYKLQYFDQELSDTLSSYRMNLYLNGDYQARDIGVHVKTYSEYHDQDNQTDFKFYELYGDLNLSVNSFLLLGKKTYNWGKGYAFNPVGYVNPKKDPENPELPQEGTFSFNYEYSKSFQSEVIKNTAFDLIVIPSDKTINNKTSETKDADIAAKLYFLLWNTDIDFMGYYSRTDSKNIGFDFSRNISTNLEIHGEFNQFLNQPKYMISNNNLKTASLDGASYLIGIRWLNALNITTILEYYRNEAGLDQNEFEDYNNFLEHAVTSGNIRFVSDAMNTNKNHFSGTNIMRDYLYLKLTWPEPFNLVYFTPSLYSIFNMNDESYMIGIPLSYKPITNFEFILWPVFLTGSTNTEFGSKKYSSKLDLWVRFYF